MFVTALPEAIEGASGVLTGVGASVEATGAGTAPVTTGIIPPSATDPTAVLMTEALNLHAGLADAMLAEWSALHTLFTVTTATSGLSYAASEVANTAAVG